MFHVKLVAPISRDNQLTNTGLVPIHLALKGKGQPSNILVMSPSFSADAPWPALWNTLDPKHRAANVFLMGLIWITVISFNKRAKLIQSHLHSADFCCTCIFDLGLCHVEGARIGSVKPNEETQHDSFIEWYERHYIFLAIDHFLFDCVGVYERMYTLNCNHSVGKMMII